MKLHPFEHLCQRLPSTKKGNTLHPKTMLRWHRHGVLRDGVRVKLKAVKVGGRWCSTRVWLDEFFAGTTGESVTIASPSEEKRRVDRVVKEWRAGLQKGADSKA